MTEIVPAEIPRIVYRELSDFGGDQAILTDAIANGTATEIAVQPAVHTGPPTRVVHQNTVYEISATVVAEAGVIGYEYSVTLDSVDDGDSQSGMVAYDALPAVDREKLAAEGFDTEAVTEPGDLGYGFQLRYTPAEREQSALIPRPTQPVIRWESDVVGRFRVTDRETVTGTKYRYHATELGSCRDRGHQIRNAHAIPLENLSARQREIVAEAINSPDGFETAVGGTATAAKPTRDLFARFQNNATKMLTQYDNNTTQRLHMGVGFLVIYDNTLYLAEVRLPPH